MSKTNFDLYLRKQFDDPAFAGRFERADKKWEDAIKADAAISSKAAAKGKRNRLGQSSVRSRTKR